MGRRGRFRGSASSVRSRAR